MKSKLVKSMLAVLLCGALITGLCVSLLGGSAEAYTSLQHIEEIVLSMKDNQESFVILEIAAEKGSGSIGYYTKGGEPCADWKSELAALTSPEARASYMSTLISSLESRHILSTGDTTPLTIGSGYSEALPWGDTTGKTALALDHTETASVTGTFSAGRGDYAAHYVYNYIGTGGDYDLDAQELTSTVDAVTDAEGNVTGYTAHGFGAPTPTYYYQCKYETYDAENIPQDGTVLYTLSGDGTYTRIGRTGDAELTLAEGTTYYYSPTFTVFYHPGMTTSPTLTLGSGLYTEENGIYTFYGIMSGDLALDRDETYYTLGTFESTTTEVKSGYGWYAFTGTVSYYASEPAGAGAFRRSIDYYSYVGGGSGDYRFDASTGSDSAQIRYSAVFCSGGYTNNNWFLKYVFDRENSDLLGMSFIVNSVQPGAVTAEMAAAADMIVLAPGSYTSYLSEGAYNALLAAVENYCPTVVDVALAQSDLAGSNMDDLARAVLGATALYSTDADKCFVEESVLCYNASTLGALAGNTLGAVIASGKTSGFEAVLEEIKYDNFLRGQQNLSADNRLPEALTVGNLLRYIINFSGQRTVSAKTSMKVLDIEPGGTSTGALSADDVYEWLGGSAGTIKKANITIDTMSTYEFVGTLADLNEEYDLIYVGAALDSFNTNSAGTSTLFNDETMNGLIYMNIGDSYRTYYDLCGLLDRDYYGSSNITSSGDSNLFRFSGNDLTAIRADDLKEFAAAGYPVILADALVDDGAGSNMQYTATLKATARDNGEVYLSVILTGPNGAVPTAKEYTWYKNNAATTYSTAQSSITVNAPQSGSDSYYCVVSVENGTSATTNTLTVSSRSGWVFEQDSSGESSFYGSKEYTAKITLKNGKLTASLTDSAGNTPAGVTYQWQRWQDAYKGGYWRDLSGATSSSYTLNQDGYYRCTFTLNGSSEKSNYVYVERRGNYSITTGNTSTTVKLPGTEMSVSLATSSADGTITANVSGVPSGASLYYYWYKYDAYYDRYYYFTDGYGDSYRTIDADVYGEGSYYCVAYYNYNNSNNGWVSARSNTVEATKGGVSVTDNNTPGTGTFTSLDAIDAAAVDNCSYMYSALSGIMGYENVMSAKTIAGSEATLLRYLNLSKPSITLTASPATYSIDDDGNMTSLSRDANGYCHLTYTFSIKNETEATPGTTTYDCRLFLDQNSDGKYREDEEITDTVIRNANSALMYADANGVYSLKANTQYTLTRQMPASYVGVIPWKLSVVKNGASGIHASVSGYTRAAPNANTQVEEINILQINSVSNNTYSLDLSDQLKTTSGTGYRAADGRTYKGLFGKLIADVEDFNIQITTVTSSNVNSKGSQSQIEAYLDNYDMLIIGFADVYTDLSSDTAKAIVSFAEDKAVLFTHDTTSPTNVSNSVSIPSVSGHGAMSRWGYYFNTILRPVVGLDRYGITSSYRSTLKTQTGSTNYSGSAASIIKAGYTAAWDAKSALGSTVAETQGLSNYLLLSQGYGNKYGVAAGVLSISSGRTTRVTQVNEGQITTYPYNVNTADFGGSGSYITVAKTHEQYYQINLNSDDIVVWYCLANDTANNVGYMTYNDAVNGYYIYTKGNITYSGMGHFAYGNDANDYYTGGSTAYINEAKLFVNTMIAAYRTVSESPNVSFTNDSGGESATNYYYLTSEASLQGDSISLGSDLLDTAASERFYLKISDPSLNANNTLTVTFYYSTDPTRTEEDFAANYATDSSYQSVTITLRSVDNDAVTAHPTGGLVYYFNLPSDVLTALSSSASVKLFARITASGVEGAGVDSVEIRKIGLFKLD